MTVGFPSSIGIRKKGAGCVDDSPYQIRTNNLSSGQKNIDEHSGTQTAYVGARATKEVREKSLAILKSPVCSPTHSLKTVKENEWEHT